MTMKEDSRVTRILTLLFLLCNIPEIFPQENVTAINSSTVIFEISPSPNSSAPFVPSEATIASVPTTSTTTTVLFTTTTTLPVTYGPIPVNANSEFHKLDWYRPRIQDLGSGNYNGFASTLEDFSLLKRRVILDACKIMEFRALSEADAMTNQWRVYDIDDKFVPGNEPIFVEENYNCYIEWQAPIEGNFIAYFRVSLDNRVITEAVTTFFIRDIWIASLGDSYSSGQGNPDVQSSFFGIVPAKWLEPGCRRSARGSYSFMLYEKLAAKYPKHGILLTFLACNGASLKSGMLGSQSGRRAQLQVLEEILESSRADCPMSCENSLDGCSCKRGPDMVLVGIGGNDLEYSRVVRSILTGRPWSELQAAPGRLKQMEERLEQMNSRLERMRIDPSSIHYVEYFDLLRNDKGILDANCGGVGLGTTWDFFLADALIRKPINDLIGKTCTKHGWTKVDGIDELFSRHGVCAHNTFIRLLPDSVMMQGDWNGAFHPNYQGQAAVAEIIWSGYAERYFQLRLS